MPEQPSPRQAPSEQRITRYGLWLFAIYLAFYAGFVFLNAFAADMMAADFFAGINLAVIYGMALIFSALALALVYCFLCRGALPSPPAEDGK